MGARRECDILEHTVQPRPLGAKRLWDVTTENFEWTTMADVECNEFCVVQAESS